MRALLPILLVLVFAAPARADIVDIRAEQAGDSARILFVFDSQPDSASINFSGAEAQATIAGVHGEGQLLRPAGGAMRQVSVADRPLGLSVGLIAGRPIREAEAEVYRNAVLFDLVLTGAPAPEPAPPPAAEAEPRETETAALNTGQMQAMGGAPAEPEPAAETAPPPEPEPEPAPEPEPEPARAALPPGAAAELLAARLTDAQCQAAGLAVAADPWALDSLYDHGACLARRGERERAREVFDRLASFDPGSPRIMVALGVLAAERGDPVQAEAYYRRAMANSPDDGLATLIRVLRELT